MSAGKVTAIWGSAFIRHPDGTMVPLHVGDKVAGGVHIVTDDDGLVQISPTKGPAILVKSGDTAASVDKTIAAIEARDPDEAPGAGLGGGADGGMQPGLRVDRVAESTGQLSFDFDAASRTSDAVTGATGTPFSQIASGPGGTGAGTGGGTGTDTSTGTEPVTTPSAVRIGDVVVNEGAGTATFTVTLDKASATAVSVSYATGGPSDTASPGADYVKTQGTLTFEPGQTSKTITVQIINDNTYEGPEHFVVNLSDATGNAVITTGQGTGEILDDGRGSVPPGVTPDDDRPHAVEVSGSSTTEGGELYFVVQLSPGTAFGADPAAQHVSAFDTPLGLKLTVLGDHPAALKDVVQGDSIEYSLDGGNTYLPLQVDDQGYLHGIDGSLLSLPAYSPTTPIVIKMVSVVNDVLDGTQTLDLSAQTPYDAAPVHGTSTISDTPAPPALPYLLVESGEPAVEGLPVVFNVKLTHAIDQPLRIHLDLQDGTDSPDTPEHEGAIAGVDTSKDLEYFDTASGEWLAVQNGDVTLAAGQTEMQVRVATYQDNLDEDTEYIKLHAHVQDPGLTANTDHANQTAILDNKPYLLVQSGEPATEGSAVVFDVVLTHATDKAVSVHLEVQSGTDSPDTPEHEGAIAGVDTGTDLAYFDTASGEWLAAENGNVTLAAGQTEMHVRVATYQDNLDEDTEYIKLHAHVESPGLTANTDHANQTAILDNKPYVLVQSGEPVQEGSPVVFDVVLTHATDKPVTVALTLGSGIDDPDTPENESATLGVDTGTQLEYLDAASGHWLQMPTDNHVTFQPGDTLIQVRVATYADNLVEDTEYIKLQVDVVDESAHLVANASQYNQTAIIDTSALTADHQTPSAVTTAAVSSSQASQALDLRDLLPDAANTADHGGSSTSLVDHHMAFDANAANAQIVASLLNQSKAMADHA
ncbi:MAG: Calx-beta domain-containing protein [Aquabacterium sp.]